MAASQNHEVASAAEPGVWIWDHDRRRIVWANDSALRFWGERTVLDLLDRDFPPADTATEQFARLLHAATAPGTERVRARLTLAPAGKPRRVDSIASRFVLADGRIGLQISATPLPVGMASEPERMREIFATAPVAMALFAEDGRLLVQNDASELAFGSGRLGGLTARYGERAPARDALRALLVSGSFSETAALTTRAGPRRFRVTMRRMLDPVTGGFAALASFSDIAQRETTPVLSNVSRAADAKDDGRSLLAGIDAGVAIYDDALKPLHINDAARRLLGLSADAAPVPLTRLFAQDRERIAAALLGIRDGRAETATLDLSVPLDGTAMRPVALTLRKGRWQGASAWVATVTDAAQGATDDRDAALEAMGVGTVLLHRDGSVARMNATAADLLGRAPDDLRPLAASFDVDDAAAFAFALDGEHRSGKLEVALEQDGERLILGIAPPDRLDRDRRVVTLRTGASGQEAKPGIFERREAVSRASHELRTPLNAIIGFTQFMLEDPAPIRSEAYVGYLKDINDSGAYMLRLLQDLLDIRRIEADALKLDSAPIDLGNLLRVIVKEVEFAARKRDVEIVLSVEPDLPAVLADLHTMRQALTNLIGNAVKFTAASGWVRVTVLQRHSGGVQVEVIDNGDGMTPDELAVALEPFGQMAGSQQGFGGAGMGVPLAKGFVEANRARFDLTSEKGLGTVARIVFPSNRITERGR